MLYAPLSITNDIHLNMSFGSIVQHSFVQNEIIMLLLNQWGNTRHTYDKHHSRINICKLLVTLRTKINNSLLFKSSYLFLIQ